MLKTSKGRSLAALLACCMCWLLFVIIRKSLNQRDCDPAYPIQSEECEALISLMEGSARFPGDPSKCEPHSLADVGEAALMAKLDQNECLPSVDLDIASRVPSCQMNPFLGPLQVAGHTKYFKCNFFDHSGCESQMAGIACDIMNAQRAGQPEIVLDIGMNAGIFSLISASQGLEVIAVEPQIGCVLSTQLSLARSGLGHHVRIINCGAADGFSSFPGTTHACSVGFDTVGALSKSKEERARASLGATTTVYTTTVDHILANHVKPNTQVVWAKVDTEGNEVNVVRGAQQALKRCAIRNWIIEVIPHKWSDLNAGAQTFAELLTVHGYKAHVLVDEFGFELNKGLDKVDAQRLRLVVNMQVFLFERAQNKVGANVWFSNPLCKFRPEA